ncbi:MAG: ead/Ea22-like family protein [Citrobacter sp.]|nr:ead/Ea22-like family protein [Citrobacter sp.]
MGSNIIELAKLGHERAAELKASCGAVDVRSVAQLISDLATQLEVQFVRSTNMAVQLANAESKCRELAVECKTLSRFISGSCYVFDGDHDDDMPDEFIDASHYMPIATPATDAFLAEVRASARNEGINYAASRLAAAYNHGFIDKPLAEVSDVVRMILDAKDELANATIPPADGLSGEYAEKSLAEFAAQLRKGAAL